MVMFEVRQLGIDGLDSLLRPDRRVVAPGVPVERVRVGQGGFPIRWAISNTILNQEPIP